VIDELHVGNYALIEAATLEFSARFTVLTGETGAGKTALVGAIKLLIGERADVGAISDGADELRVSARILMPSGAGEAGDEVIVSRRLNRAGRSRASIDGEMVAVAELAERIGSRFDLLGQHEHQKLLSTSAQLAFLDKSAGEGFKSVYQQYLDAFRKHQAAADELAALNTAALESTRSLSDARFALQQIEAVNPKEDEYRQLQEDLPILRSGEELAHAAETAWQLLRDEDRALDFIAQADRVLGSARSLDARLDQLAERLTSAQIDLEDIASEMLAYRDSVSFDADALGLALDRLSELESLMRRFGPRIEDVLALREQAQRQLSIADNLPELVAAANAELERCEESLVAAADALARARREAAISLSARLSDRLTSLAFSGATIQASIVDLPRSDWGPAGSQRFELLYQPGPRLSARPLARIASGGELSRVMLALKSELLADEGLTLVFDEVDAGIGGAAATAVALFLRRLADIHQVIVVTHLAQIAALADRHYVVEKSAGGGSDAVVGTVIYEVDGELRVAELARMLSGSTDSAALNHARELLKR